MLLCCQTAQCPHLHTILHLQVTEVVTIYQRKVTPKNFIDEYCYFEANMVIFPLVSAASANNSTISLPNGYILPECPAPFLKDPLATAGTNNSVSPDSCSNGCCIPCPVQDYLYPVGWVAKGFIATDVIRTISAVCALFLVISYAILPDKRTHPSLLIFEFSIALFLYSADVVFALGNPKRIQCSTDIVASTQDNNVLCAAQGKSLFG